MVRTLEHEEGIVRFRVLGLVVVVLALVAAGCNGEPAAEPEEPDLPDVDDDDVDVRPVEAALADGAPVIHEREADRVARLMSSRGWSEEQARAVLAVQRPAEWFRDAADLTIENTAGVAELERAARAAVVRLMAERRAALRPA